MKIRNSGLHFGVQALYRDIEGVCVCVCEDIVGGTYALHGEWNGKGNGKSNGQWDLWAPWGALGSPG